MVSKRKGSLIVIEGSDGSGKATQQKLLENYLREQQYRVETIDFPRYYDSFYGKFIARYLQGEFGTIKDVNPYLISLAYALDRGTAAPRMKEWISNGLVVIANRYVPSNLAHQSGRLKPADRAAYLSWATELEYKVNALPKEDIVIFLYVPYRKSIELMKSSDRKGREYNKGTGKEITEESRRYLRQSEAAYKRLLKKYKHWVKIDCIEKGEMKSREQIHLEIRNILEKKKII